MWLHSAAPASQDWWRHIFPINKFTCLGCRGPRKCPLQYKMVSNRRRGLCVHWHATSLPPPRRGLRSGRWGIEGRSYCSGLTPEYWGSDDLCNRTWPFACPCGTARSRRCSCSSDARPDRSHHWSDNSFGRCSLRGYPHRFRCFLWK